VDDSLDFGVLPSLALCGLIHCKHEQDQLFYSFRLGDAAPEDHPMHRDSKVRSEGNARDQRRTLGIPAEGLSAIRWRTHAQYSGFGGLRAL
jgi:hypothetical protein